MKKINQLALVLTKCLEVLHWLGVAAMAVIFMSSLFAREWLSNLLSQGIGNDGTAISTYGFEMEAVYANGKMNMTAVMLFSIGAVVILSLMAMVFRNVYLIMKTAKGKTWFSKGNTPFQNDIVRMVREIGIFCISIPVIGLILSVIGRFVIGVETAEISINFESFVIGILVLCLSQIFAYGTELQKDADGLI